MTREEALEILTSHITTGLRSGKRILSEAMNEAIKALRDCEHCSKTYGTVGCCDTSCEEGHREYAEKLKQTEPCEDAISRSFMKELGAECIAVRDERGVLVAITPIDSLPSVQPKTKTGWIPVSEKLPEKFIDVVVWYARPFSDEQWYGIGYLKENGKWDVDGKSRQEVLAWMPLPEPYKESEEEG